MAGEVRCTKAKPSKMRRLSFLPRIGLSVEIAGREFQLKRAPILETVLNTIERGVSLRSFKEVARAQLDEILASPKPVVVEDPFFEEEDLEDHPNIIPFSEKATIVRHSPTV